MPELFDIRSSGLDARAERDLARKVSEAENAARATIERERRIVAERRAELEAQVASEEQELCFIKENAMALQEEVAAQRQAGGEGQNLVDVWPELEEASAAARQVQADLTSAKQRGLAAAEASQERHELDSGLFQMYTASTGVHWDHSSQHVEGYVALGSARHFCSQDSKPDKNLETPGKKAARAECLWQEIEASLGMPPSAAELGGAPWEATPGGA